MYEDRVKLSDMELAKLCKYYEAHVCFLLLYVEQVFGIVRMGRFAGVQSQMGVRRGHQVNSGVLIKGKEFDGIFIFWFFLLIKLEEIISPNDKNYMGMDNISLEYCGFALLQSFL